MCAKTMCVHFWLLCEQTVNARKAEKNFCANVFLRRPLGRFYCLRNAFEILVQHISHGNFISDSNDWPSFGFLEFSFSFGPSLGIQYFFWQRKEDSSYRWTQSNIQNTRDIALDQT